MTMAPQGEILGEVRLARDPRRLIVIPLVGALSGVALAAAGWLLISRGSVGVTVLAAGLMLAMVSGYLALRLTSVRLLVRPGALDVRWFGGHREYLLVRGQLGRISLEGGSAALRAHLGPLGVGLGRATLPSNERIDLLRLARATTFLMVPTDRGRLAIAAASEADLLTALRAAASAQSAVGQPPIPVARPATVLSQPAWPVERVGRAPSAESSQPRFMTGIERALLEERLAAQRAAALAMAEAQVPDAQGQPAQPGSPVEAMRTPQPAAPAPNETERRVARERARATWARPAWVAIPGRVPGSQQLAGGAPIIAPLLIAAVGWLIALSQERLGGPYPEARYLVLALALTGPLAVFAALVARSWQPRITGLVAWSAIGAQVVIARALFG